MYCKKRNSNSEQFRSWLTAKELNEALIVCIKQCQKQQFSQEIEDFIKTGKVHKKSVVTSLNPFIDNDGLLRLYVRYILNMWNLGGILRKLGTNEQCVAFSEQEGLVLKEKKCPVHRSNMKILYSVGCKHFGTFVCSKGTCRTKFGGNGRKISRRKGTFFENTKIDLIHVFYLIYAYARGWSHENVILEDPYKELNSKCLSSCTIADWFSYCREVIVIYYLEKKLEFSGKIGGPGKIVQIDESKFGKRKYNKGTTIFMLYNFFIVFCKFCSFTEDFLFVSGRHIEGHWVLGMIEDGSQDLRLEVCPDNIRSAEVLIPLIQKHVQVGTTIHTDCWRAYNCLSDYGYVHKQVNHSDPENPFVGADGIHTQRIEAQWRVVKSFFRTKHFTNMSNFTDLIIEYLWRRYVIKFKKDAFVELVNAIKFVYELK
ncbi:hypothetical protein K1T71_015304 [Dendrolimus kikuchii]|nr:hypothetical protein K1T71_014905 [Dendrolimus kikuchii]KAJ0169196.1 hypothetical protein K1T71_015304 [Dendrolimus kikuchii]